MTEPVVAATLPPVEQVATPRAFKVLARILKAAAEREALHGEDAA